jgi:hypothetical protein
MLHELFAVVPKPGMVFGHFEAQGRGAVLLHGGGQQFEAGRVDVDMVRAGDDEQFVVVPFLGQVGES